MRVKGQGPKPCHLMFVGEGPGVKESETGVPFHPQAPAGAELTRYLNGVALPQRDQVYITNLVKEWEGGAPKKKQEVTEADILRDQWELQVELMEVKPTIVCTLGGHATRWFLGKDVSMDAVHGRLFQQPLQTDHVVYVLPCYHPAAGLHQPEMAARTAHDLARLAALLPLVGTPWLLAQHCWQPGKIGTYLQAKVTGKDVSAAGKEPDTQLLGIDTEGYPGQMWYMSVAPKDGEAYVFKGPQAPFQTITNPCVFHNYMHDMQVLEPAGCTVDETKFHDTQVMAYLLGTEPQALKDLAMRHLGLDLPEYKDVVGKHVQEFKKDGTPKKKQKFVMGTLDDIDPQKAIDYAGADSDITRRLFPILMQQISEQGLEQVYEIDRRVLPVYARMEQVGMPVNRAHFQEFQKWLGEELEVRTWVLQTEYPNLNPGSADQVADILFNHLKLPGAKKTPSGKRFATTDEVLQDLKHKTHHPFVEAILEWREIQKLKTTFVDCLPVYCREHTSGLRLHYRLLPTRVVSGRLAATDPNVLAFPKHSALGKRFRGGIEAGPGCLLGSWDLNQIELRVLAIDSGSTTLQQVFKDGVDLHARTGEKIFGVAPKDQDDSLHRLPSKTTNFSIIMGTTGIGLADQQRKNGYKFPELMGQSFKSLEERRKAEAEVCQGWVNTIIADWGIAGYIQEKHAEARRYGYVRDLWGRRRYLPSVLSPNKQIREEALRQAQSFGPQAGARGFYKTILYRVWTEVIKPLRAEGAYIEPLLDLHDDLFLEFEEVLAGLLLPLVSSVFNSTFMDQPIPITCKGKIGKKWSDL